MGGISTKNIGGIIVHNQNPTVHHARIVVVRESQVTAQIGDAETRLAINISRRNVPKRNKLIIFNKKLKWNTMKTIEAMEAKIGRLERELKHIKAQRYLCHLKRRKLRGNV